jgi:acyl-CoA dehydrogenase
MKMSKVAIPFSDPPWLMGLPSAYYNDSHRKWQKTCRAIVDELMMPDAGEWEQAGDVPGMQFHLYSLQSLTPKPPEDLYSKFAARNFLIPNLYSPLPVKWLKKLGIHELPGGLKVEDFDYLHTLIYIDEMARTGSAGPSGAVTTGVAFGLPPILKFGSQELQERFVPDVITGKKRICIAITEPGAGSDVGNVATTAVRTDDGKHFIVNGTKKWYIFPILKLEL